MKQIPIKEHQIIQRLDLLAQDFYKLPHRWTYKPLPRTTAADLREKMADESDNGYPKPSNSIDYAGRAISKDFKQRSSVFLGSVRQLTDNQAWYWDSMVFQPPATGWTAWSNGGDRPRHFFRFIHNSENGFTNFIKDGKRIKVADQHNPTTTKDWTCVAGMLDGETTWISDRNIGDTPRIVFDISIPSRYHDQANAFAKFISTPHG